MAVESQCLGILPSQVVLGDPSALYTTPPDLLGDFATAGRLDLLDATRAGFTTPLSAPSAPPAAVVEQRKRRRTALAPPEISFLGEDISSLMLQQQHEIDCVIAQHVEKIRATITKRRKTILNLILAAVRQGVARRLRVQEEGIEQISMHNRALEVQISNLSAENLVWREVAQRNMAAANALRCNLEQILTADEQFRADNGGGFVYPTAEDARSSCGIGGGDPTAVERSMCQVCGLRETAVLLLPCRHLCVCVSCSPATAACPMCQCSTDSNVAVNLSS